MAHHAFGPAGVAPNLLAGGTILVTNLEFLVSSLFFHQMRFGLFLVPQVGVAGPFVVGANHQAGFNPTLIR